MEVEGIGLGETVRGGRRKGREPVGEAWFEEGEVRKGTWERRRRVCHLRHVGFIDGFPSSASSSEEKI